MIMSEKTNKALAETLGIETKQEIIVPEKKVVEVMPAEETGDAEADYKLSRKTFRELIGKGNDAIDHLFDLAKSSDHPRAYEVLGTLIKTVSDTTKDLYDLQKKSKDLKTVNDKPQDQGIVNVERAVFVGSTADLLKKVKEAKE
jgi:hypothetical protein